MTAGNAWTPVIIVGAARSGTNMLRDVLTRLPGVGTWPCDEINYIWRHGNRGYPTDAFPPELARPPVKAFIRRAFERLADKKNLRLVAEKTCANSLRLDFVRAVLPEARFIHILRDGRDAALSAVKRWKSPKNLIYILTKARFVPLTDVPYHALRYMGNRLYRLFSCQKRLKIWGPVFEGIEEALRKYPILVCSALQWQACVQAATVAFRRMPQDRVQEVRYEEFVQSPVERLAPILEFLGVEADRDQRTAAVGDVFGGSVGLWREKMSRAEVEAVEEAIGETLRSQGYA